MESHYRMMFLANAEQYTKELHDYELQLQVEREQAEAFQLEFEQRMLNEQLINSYGTK